MEDQPDPDTPVTDGVTGSLLHKHNDAPKAGSGSAPASDPQESTPSTAKLGKLARLRKNWRDLAYRRNVWKTVGLGCSFWGLGFALSQRGPAFLDLQIITGTDVEGASYFFTSHSAGYVLGSLVAGVIYDLLNKSLLLLLSLVGLGLTTMATPWCAPYWLMIAINFVSALFASAVDTAGTAEILRLWGKEGEMAMQFLHWAYAFGGVLGPLATEPFLTPTLQGVNETGDSSILTTTTATNSSKSNNSSTSADIQSLASHSLWQGTSVSPDEIWKVTSSSPSDATVSDLRNMTPASQSVIASVFNLSLSGTAGGPPSATPASASAPARTTDVHYAFLISGGLILLITIPFILQLYSDRRRQQQRQPDEEEREKEKKKKKKKSEQRQPLPTGLFLFVQGFLCLLYLLHCCGEDTAISYLTTFVVMQLGWTTSRGARLSALFWTMFASCRFVCIFLVHVISSAKLLTLSCLCLTLSQVGILFFASRGVDVGIWVAVMCMGTSVAAIFPTGFSWMEEELVRVTGRVTSSIFVSGSVGMTVVPVLVGYLMQEVTPMWYVYLLVFFSSSTFALFLFLLVLSRVYLRKRRRTFSSVLEVVGSGEKQCPSLEESAQL